MISIINYQAGNAPSVFYALESMRLPCQLVSTPQEIEQATHLILPGVGAAKATLLSLHEMGCMDILHKKVMEERIPFFGICVGMQVLFEKSEEEQTDCLGWIKGTVKQFPSSKVRVPQMGWNEVAFSYDHPFIAGLPRSSYFYFVNSYFAKPESPDVVLGSTQYGDEFCSVVAYKNIVATQFHAEKSGAPGLKLLANFAAMEKVPC